MKRAILVALGVGAIASSAAAFSIGANTEPGAILAMQGDYEVAVGLTRQASRARQRSRIEERYQEDRAKCASLGGARRDSCLVQAHAGRGRAMLHAAAPYEVRF